MKYLDFIIFLSAYLWFSLTALETQNPSVVYPTQSIIIFVWFPKSEIAALVDG